MSSRRRPAHLLLVSVLVGALVALPEVRSAAAAARPAAPLPTTTSESSLPTTTAPPISTTSEPPLPTTSEPAAPTTTELPLPTTSEPAPPTTTPPPPPTARSLELRDVAYGPDPAHRLDILRGNESNGLAVLWLHAGGWTSGDRTGTGPVVDQLVADGAVVVSADYRLTPDHVFPAQIHDVKRAIRWIKAHRSDVPHRRLVVAGASAGGHLAALAAVSAGALEPTDLPPELAAHDSSVDGAVALSGPMDLTRFWLADHPWAKGLSDGFLDCDSAECDPTRMHQASPVHWVDPADPPLYLAAGTADTLVTAGDNADRMFDTIQVDGDPTRCWYDRVDGGTHNLWDTLDLTRLQQFLAGFDLVPSDPVVVSI